MLIKLSKYFNLDLQLYMAQYDLELKMNEKHMMTILIFHKIVEATMFEFYVFNSLHPNFR
ncbi:hypothetical protein CR513_17471, partial [Mucuna pruriens]